MSQTAVIMLFVLLAVLVIGIVLAVGLSRRSRLRSLPEESRDRYARSWRGIENQFIDDPRGAVKEADRVVVMMLSERGATVTDEAQVPEDLRWARQAAAADKGSGSTEGMRVALVHYKKIVDDSIGTARMKSDGYRREVAS